MAGALATQCRRESSLYLDAMSRRAGLAVNARAAARLKQGYRGEARAGTGPRAGRNAARAAIAILHAAYRRTVSHTASTQKSERNDFVCPRAARNVSYAGSGRSQQRMTDAELGG